MKHLYSLMVMAATMLGAQAQVITTQPAVVQQSTPNIVVTYHADMGNKGLMGVKPPTKVYAHTGVITNLSTSDTDWKHAPTWGTNTTKYEMTWVADNTWTLTIPSIDSYYGLSSTETVKKLAFVFRTADSSREGKTESGGDIFVNVLPEGFQAQLTASPDGKVFVGEPITFTAATTSAASIKLYINSTSTEPIAQISSGTELKRQYVFPTAGTYKVIAQAQSGNEFRELQLQVAALSPSVAQTFPGGVPKMGYTLGANGEVTFCIAAPNKETVVMVDNLSDYNVLTQNTMYYQDYQGQRYFWITRNDIPKNKDFIYYYLIDGTTSVGDPYAPLVLDPWNDKYISSSVFPDLPQYPTDKVQGVPLALYNPSRQSYTWDVETFNRIDPSELVIYELLIRDFTGTEGQARGNGTIAGVMGKLDYLQSLGVNAIELLPIMEFNGNNSWGYNTNFYFAPDKAYGTPRDYKMLIDECHRRGIAVILDIVFNQSDGLHPWYQMYDIAQNPFYNGSAPHSYSVLNDWNQDNPLVAQQWADCVQYWLTEYKADGFRFDLVKGLGNNDSYGNTYYPATNTWAAPSEANTNAYNATRVARMKAIHDVMRKVSPTAYFINENLAGAQEENDMAKDGELNWANINEASCQFAMGFQSGSNTSRFYAPLDSRTWGSTVSYAESHDEERMAYKQALYGGTGIKGDEDMSTRRLGSVAAQMLMTPGAHMLWQFQEFGADETTKNSDGGNNTSPKKVIWSYLDNEYNAGLMQSYKELIYLRRNNPQMFEQSTTTAVKCAQANWTTGRTITLTRGTSELFLVVNPNTSGSRNIPINYTQPQSSYQLLSASYGVTPVLNAASVALPAGAYAVYGTTDLTDVPEILPDNLDANAPIEYYNLQGIRVENPATGHIYIMRQGAQSSTVKL